MADNGRQEGDSIRFSVLDLLKPVQANMYLKRTRMSSEGRGTPSKKIIGQSVDFVPLDPPGHVFAQNLGYPDPGETFSIISSKILVRILVLKTQSIVLLKTF